MSQGELFQGICIGGPLDGQIKMYDAPEFEIIKPPGPCSYEEFTREQTSIQTIETIRYRYDECRVNGDRVGGMWVVEHFTLQDAVSALFASYEKNNGQNNPDR